MLSSCVPKKRKKEMKFGGTHDICLHHSTHDILFGYYTTQEAEVLEAICGTQERETHSKPAQVMESPRYQLLGAENLIDLYWVWRSIG